MNNISHDEQLSNYVKCLEATTSLPRTIRTSLLQIGKIFGEYRNVAVLLAEIDDVNLVKHPDSSTLYDPATAGEVYVGYLNEILRLWLPLIESSGGSILELQPDRILAVWGIPMTADFYVDAMETATKMQAACKELGDNHGIPQDFAFRVGIAGGQVYTGLIGTEMRQSYAVVGPVIACVSRLSRIARPGQILLAQTVYDQIKHTAIVCQRHPRSEEGCRAGTVYVWG